MRSSRLNQLVTLPDDPSASKFIPILNILVYANQRLVLRSPPTQRAAFPAIRKEQVTTQAQSNEERVYIPVVDSKWFPQYHLS